VEGLGRLIFKSKGGRGERKKRVRDHRELPCRKPKGAFYVGKEKKKSFGHAMDLKEGDGKFRDLICVVKLRRSPRNLKSKARWR